jgi:hypothetical protein
MRPEADARVAAALRTMQNNRELLVRAYARQRPGTGAFPRSRTFRWLATHMSGTTVVTTLLSTVLLRRSWLGVLASLALRRRPAR